MSRVVAAGIGSQPRMHYFPFPVKNCLYVLLFLLSCHIQAQDYRLLRPEMTYIFGHENYSSGETQYDHAIRFDSVAISGSDTLRFNYRVTNVDTNNFLVACYYSYRDTSWLNNYCIERPGNRWIFLNEVGDSIFWEGRSGSWKMYEWSNRDYIEATVSGTALETVLGTTDSVRTVTLQAYDNLGAALNHPVNQREFKVAKTTGLVQAASFWEFPDTVTGLGGTLQLAGTMNPERGIGNLDQRRIWDLDVGDSIQVHVRSSNFQHESETRIQWVILSKAFSGGLDTVTYAIEEGSFGFFTDNNGTANSRGRDTIVVTQAIARPLDPYDFLPQESQPTMALIGNPYDQPTYYSGPDYNGRLQKEHRFSAVLGMNLVDTCYDGIFIHGWNAEFGIEGLGGGYYFQTGIPYAANQWWRLPTWFRKGTETWGTWIDFDSVLTAVDKPVTSIGVRIFPQPLTDRAYVRAGDDCPDCRMEFFDLAGKMVHILPLNISEHTPLDRSNFPTSGLYYFRLMRGTEGYDTGKVWVR